MPSIQTMAEAVRGPIGYRIVPKGREIARDDVVHPFELSVWVFEEALNPNLAYIVGANRNMTESESIKIGRILNGFFGIGGEHTRRSYGWVVKAQRLPGITQGLPE